MELLQLIYFKALAEGTTLTKTAEQLFITPPALSRSIKNLEEELGVQLFDRNARSMTINEHGRNFMKYVSEALTLLDNGRRMLEDSVSSNQTLSICVMGPVFYIEMINDFQTLHPEILVARQYESLNKFDINTLLAKYDCVLTCPDDLKNCNLSYHLLYDSAYPLLIMHPEHPLAKLKSIRLIEAKDEMFLLPPSTESAGKYFRSLLEKAGYFPKKHRICEMVVREKLLYDNTGVTLGTSHSMLEMFSPAMKGIPISDPCILHSQAIISHVSRFQSQALKSFIRFATDYYIDGWENPFQEEA